MNIAKNILKHSLRNVYFLAGTAMGGKTTMTKIFSEKYGFTPYYEDWNGKSYLEFLSICDVKYQPQVAKQIDFESHFDKTVEEFLAEKAENTRDYWIEFALIDLIKLSQNTTVITDLYISIELLSEISDFNHVVCMLASPGLVTCENYGKRESHKAFLDCLMSLKEPEKKIAVQDELFRIEAEKIYNDVRKYNFFNIIRTEDSTIENTLKLLEKHFHF